MSSTNHVLAQHSGNGFGNTPIHDQVLLKIVAGTYAQVGGDFFRSLVCHLAEALHVRYAFISELCRCADDAGTHAGLLDRQRFWRELSVYARWHTVRRRGRWSNLLSPTQYP